MNFWNSYFNGLIYLSERSAYPLQMFLREILLNNMADSMIDTAGMDISKFMVGESIKIRGDHRFQRADAGFVSVPAEVFRQGRHDRRGKRVDGRP